TRARVGRVQAQVNGIIAAKGMITCAVAPLVRRAVELDSMLRAVRRILGERGALGGGRAAVCPHIEARGGDLGWKSSPSRSVPTASTARRTSSRATRLLSGKRRIPPGSRRT